MPTSTGSWWWERGESYEGSGGSRSYTSRRRSSDDSTNEFNMINMSPSSNEDFLPIRFYQSNTSGLDVADDPIYYADPDFVINSLDAIRGRSTRPRHKDIKGEFELERWWVTSQLWRRMIPLLLLLFFVIAFFQLLFAFYCFGLIVQEWEAEPDPYVCATPGCLDVAVRLNGNINPAADPCSNFYEFGCGKFRDEIQDPDAFPSIVRLSHAFQSFSASQEAQLSEILRPQGDKTDKAIEFYKACIDERSRLDVGIDPLLVDIRYTLFTQFDASERELREEDYVKESIEFGRLFGEFVAIRFYYLPDRKVAFSQPEWVEIYGHIYRRILETPESRRAYTVEVTSFFSALWNRMEELELIIEPPYSAETAAELVVIMINAILNYIYNPEVPLPPHTQADADLGRSNYVGLLSYTLGPNFTIVNPVTPLEKYAFGDWEGADPRQVGSALLLFVQNGPLYHDLITRWSPPLSPLSFGDQAFRAIHAFFIYLFFDAYVGDIRPETYTTNQLDKIFPDRLLHDLVRSLRIESFCLTSMVYYLNAFTTLRLNKIYNSNEEGKRRLDDLRYKMEDLRVETIWSLRSWYVRNRRAGQFDPRTHYITEEFLELGRNPLFLDFPLPALTAEQKRILDRQTSYLDEWEIIPNNYLYNIIELKRSISEGKLRDWKADLLGHGENDKIFLDFVWTRISSPESTEYRNAMSVPLLLLEPPYFLNDIPVLDYGGAALYMAGALLQIWLANTRDPGGLNIPEGILAGINSSPGRFVEEECSAIPTRDPSQRQKTSFARYMSSGDGLPALAMKAAFDLYKHPEIYQILVDLYTGEPVRFKRFENGSTQFTAPEYFYNGTVVYFTVTRDTEGSISKTPTDRRRFVPAVDLNPYKLVYTKLKTMEMYNSDQLFFLQSISNLCASSHGRGTERYERYAKLLNGVYQQLTEFGESWNCSLNAPMNPPDSCFVQEADNTIELSAKDGAE